MIAIFTNDCLAVRMMRELAEIMMYKRLADPNGLVSLIPYSECQNILCVNKHPGYRDLICKMKQVGVIETNSAEYYQRLWEKIQVRVSEFGLAVLKELRTSEQIGLRYSLIPQSVHGKCETPSMSELLFYPGEQ